MSLCSWQLGIGGKAMDTFARLVTRLAIGSSKSKSSYGILTAITGAFIHHYYQFLLIMHTRILARYCAMTYGYVRGREWLME